MTRVNRPGSLSFNRVKFSYVNRQRSSDTVEKTVAVERALGAQNQTAFSSENHLIAYDNYYRKFDKLEKDFAGFLADRESLRRQAKKEKEEGRTRQESHLYKKIRSLITKYNQAVEALLYIDKNYQTDNSKELLVILSNYEDHLKFLGIRTRELYLEIDGKHFWKAFTDSENPYEELFLPLNRLIMALYIKFRNIMIHRENLYNDFSEDYKGHIINLSS